MINEIDQQTSDIDWFFVSGDAIGFVASGCGKLPESVASLEEEVLSKISSYFRSLPEITSVVISDGLDDIMGATGTEFLSDFIYLAKRGLFAYDKLILNNFFDLNYHIVARPVVPMQPKELPIEIRNLIKRTTYKGNVSRVDFIDIKEIT